MLDFYENSQYYFVLETQMSWTGNEYKVVAYDKRLKRKMINRDPEQEMITVEQHWFVKHYLKHYLDYYARTNYTTNGRRGK